MKRFFFALKALCLLVTNAASAQLPDGWVEHSIPTQAGIGHLQFLNADVGVALTSPTIPGDKEIVLMWTEDRGATWSRTDFPSQPLIHTLHFVSRDTGMVAGADATLLTTVDGGMSWRISQIDPARQHLFTSHVLGNATWFLAGGKGIVLRSSGSVFGDGTSWTKTIINTGPSNIIHDFHFWNENDGIFIADNNRVYRTSDGGLTWSVYSAAGSSQWVSAVDFADSTSGVLVGSNGLFCRTRDAAASWSCLRRDQNPASRALWDVRFVNATTAYATGAEGVFRTDDAGETWVNEGLPRREYVALEVVDGRVFVGGANGFLASKAVVPVGVERTAPPEAMALSEVYPNPTRDRTRLSLALSRAEAVSVAVYDMLGRHVDLLHDGMLGAGSHGFEWSPADVPGGLYIIRVRRPSGIEDRTVIRLE